VSRRAPGRPGDVVWLTGLPGAGKSTLAAALAQALGAERPIEILDGDAIRAELSDDLGFSRADRDRNVRRIAFVARLLAGQGVTVLVATISPYAEARRQARAAIEGAGARFVEVHVHAELPALLARDPKGLYRRAQAGEIPHFTGVSDPYEPPPRPEVMVRSDREPVAVCVERVLTFLRAGAQDPAKR
jgi:adenylyl-sulfate kinase